MQPNNNLLIVDARHNGPPGSGNGGWTSGLIAASITEGVPEVTLQKPPPLESPMTVVRTAEGLRVIDSSNVIIATARSRQDDIAPVPPVPYTEAEAASAKYLGFTRHPFPGCFVCGPQRSDGLRIFPGHLADGRTAATFTPSESIDTVTVWAALDCPGGWTVITGEHPWVLGRMAAIVDELPEPHAECVIVGETVSVSGRKALVRTALYGPGGKIMGRAEATWIALPV